MAVRRNITPIGLESWTEGDFIAALREHMVYAAVALQRLRVPLDGRVALVFVPDEETGGRRGSGFLAATKRLGSHGIGMLTPEPTSGVV